MAEGLLSIQTETEATSAGSMSTEAVGLPAADSYDKIPAFRNDVIGFQVE
jgi:hypothetical protein